MKLLYTTLISIFFINTCFRQINTSETIAQSITLYPHPTNSTSALQTNTTTSSNIHYTIIDIHGKIVSKETIAPSTDSAVILIDHPDKAGIYLVDLVIDGVVSSIYSTRLLLWNDCVIKIEFLKYI